MFVNKEILDDLIKRFKLWKNKNILDMNKCFKEKYIYSDEFNSDSFYYVERKGNILTINLFYDYNIRVTFAKAKDVYFEAPNDDYIKDVKKQIINCFPYSSSVFSNGFFKTKHIIFIVFLLCMGFKRKYINNNEKEVVLEYYKNNILIEFNANKMIFTKAQKTDFFKDFFVPEKNDDFAYDINIDYEDGKVAFYRKNSKKKVKLKRKISPPANFFINKNMQLIKCTNKYLYFLEISKDEIKLVRSNIKKETENLKILCVIPNLTKQEKLEINFTKYENIIRTSFPIDNGTYEKSICLFINKNKISFVDNKFTFDRGILDYRIKKEEERLDFIVGENYIENIIKVDLDFYYSKKASLTREDIFKDKISYISYNKETILVCYKNKLGIVDKNSKFYSEDKYKVSKNIRNNFKEWIEEQELIAMQRSI